MRDKHGTPEQRRKSLTVRLPVDLWRKAKQKATEEERTLQDVCLTLLREWVEGKSSTQGER